MLDDRQDYFGLSVNIASRVQELADPTAILATKQVVDAAEAAGLVGARGYRASSRQLSLRGVSEAFAIYESASRSGRPRPRDESTARRLRGIPARLLGAGRGGGLRAAIPPAARSFHHGRATRSPPAKHEQIWRSSRA